MSRVNLPLNPVFEGAQVSSDHVLNCLYSALCPPIAWALSNCTEFGHHLDQLFIRNRFTMATNFGQSSFNSAADGGLLVLLVDQLRDACVLEELSKTVDDRIVRPLGVTD